MTERDKTGAPGRRPRRRTPTRGLGAKGKEAAEKAMDGDRLLPGEDAASQYLDDALHWLSVYTEMLQAKAAMLEALNERLSQTTEEVARQEIGGTDVVILERELRRFHDRIDFWRTRIKELREKGT
jgi:hypothetical protein